MINRRSAFQALASWLLAPFAARAAGPPPEPQPDRLGLLPGEARVTIVFEQGPDRVLRTQLTVDVAGETYAREFGRYYDFPDFGPREIRFKVQTLGDDAGVTGELPMGGGAPVAAPSNPSISE